MRMCSSDTHMHMHIALCEPLVPTRLAHKTAPIKTMMVAITNSTLLPAVAWMSP